MLSAQVCLDLIVSVYCVFKHASKKIILTREHICKRSEQCNSTLDSKNMIDDGQCECSDSATLTMQEI